MVNIKELLGVTSQSCNTRERALGSLPANRAFNSDQVISLIKPDGENESVHPGPGLKLQAQCDFQEALQSQSRAPSVKLSNQPVQAASDKPQARKRQLQAPSHKQQAQRYVNHGTWTQKKY